MLLAGVTGSNGCLNVVVDAGPINELACTAFGVLDALVRRVQLPEDVATTGRLSSIPSELGRFQSIVRCVLSSTP